MVEKLTTLLQSLTETGERLVHTLDETTDRSVRRLREIADSVHQSGRETTAAATRLAGLRESVNDAERNLTYQVERFEAAGRSRAVDAEGRDPAGAGGWILGGIAAALVMLTWTP